MKFLAGIGSLLANIPMRVYEYAVVLLLALSAVVFWNAHERSIGEQQLKEALAAEQAATQEKLDRAAEVQNAKIEAKFAAHQYIPIDYTLPADCTGKVPEAVRNAVNKAHKP